MNGFAWAVLGMAFFWPFIKGPFIAHFFSIESATQPWAPFVLNAAALVLCALAAGVLRAKGTRGKSWGMTAGVDASRKDCEGTKGVDGRGRDTAEGEGPNAASASLADCRRPSGWPDDGSTARARRREAACRKGIAGAGALMSLALVALAMLGDSSTGWAVVLGAVVAAAGFLVLAYAWMQASLRLVWQEDAGWDGSTDGTVACALVVSYLASYLVELPVDALPADLSTYVLAFYPLISCLCWLGFWHKADEREATGAQGADAIAAGPREAAAPARTAHSSPGLIALVAGIYLVAALLAGLCSTVPVSSSALSAVLAVLLAVFVALNRNNARFTAWVWAVALIPIFMSALLVMGFSGELFAAGLNVLTAGRRSLVVLLWLLLVGRAFTVGTRGAATACSLLYVGFYCIGRIVIDGLRFSGLDSTLSSDALHGVTLAVALVAVAGSFAIMALVVSRRASSDQAALDQAQAASMPVSPADAAAAEKALRQDACHAIAQTAGLTEKETVVLELVSLGYTVARIAQERNVSENTVRTHTKGLYRKLDVHSKQEVIELVEQTMATQAE